jgi:hypothetical protein
MLASYVSTVLGLDSSAKNNAAAELLVWTPDSAGKFQSADSAENTGGKWEWLEVFRWR